MKVEIQSNDDLQKEEHEDSGVLTKKKKKRKSIEGANPENGLYPVDMNHCNSPVVKNLDEELPQKKKKHSLNKDLDVNGGCSSGTRFDSNEYHHTELLSRKKKKRKDSLDKTHELVTLDMDIHNDSAIESNNNPNLLEEVDEIARKKKNSIDKSLKHILQRNTETEDRHVDLADSKGSCVEDAGEVSKCKASPENENLEITHRKKRKRSIKAEDVESDGVVLSKHSVTDVELSKDDTPVSSKKNKNVSFTLTENEKEAFTEKDSSMEEFRLAPSKLESWIRHCNDGQETLQEMHSFHEPNVSQNNDKSTQEDEFTIIDKVKGKKKVKVNRVLPQWLTQATTVSANLAEGVPVNTIEALDPFLKKRLIRKNISSFFPIQAAVIPELLKSCNHVSLRYRPRDVCVSAPTGSGKTLAYVLPIIQALMGRVVPQLRALVLLPTKELAHQVYKVFEAYTQFSDLKVCLANGHYSLKEEQESIVFQNSTGCYAADILVATPGRLTDHITYETLNLAYLRFLVVDEADVFMSSTGGGLVVKFEQLKKQLHRPAPDNSSICGGFHAKDSVRLPEFYLQQILISATLMHDPERLKVLNLHRPKLFFVGSQTGSNEIFKTFKYKRPQELKEEYIIVESNLKPLVLYHLINKYKLSKVLVFTKSNMATETLSIFLSTMNKNYRIEKFSSKEKKRKAILSDFSSGKIDVLISSDAIARGLDITDIQKVISYDVPAIQTYVHRIGRTARAGREGFALSIVEDTPEARRDFSAIISSCDKKTISEIKVDEDELVPYDSKYQAALSTLKKTLLDSKKADRINKIKAKMETRKKSKTGAKLKRKKGTERKT